MSNGTGLYSDRGKNRPVGGFCPPPPPPPACLGLNMHEIIEVDHFD